MIPLGGLPDEADESVVRAAFIPFGEIVNIEIPPDYENHEKHRGFSFIEYELAEDAAAAIDNMVLCCTINQRFSKIIQYFLHRTTLNCLGKP